MVTRPGIREQTEKREECLSPYAVKSRLSRGRLKAEEPCPIRTSFQRDRDRIIYSKAFRRLKHKTQVFIDPEDMSYPRISLVGDQKLRILSIEEQQAKSDKITEVTVREALDKRIIRNEVLAYFMALAARFLEDLGIPVDKQRFREVLPEERAHYSQQTFDQEVWLQRWGWTEVSGHAYRTDYDLRNHMAHTGVDLRVYKAFDQPRNVVKVAVKPKIDVIEKDFGKDDLQLIVSLIANSDQTIIDRELREKGFYELTGERPIRLEGRHVEVVREEAVEQGRAFIPHVIEPSFGIDRIVYAVLEYAYTEKGNRILFRVPKEVAPVKASVLPLVSREGLPEKAKEVYEILLDEEFKVNYDEDGSIGRRYARADEIGIPLGITIDYQTLQDDTVTLRDVYTWKQVRSGIKDLPKLLREYFKGKLEFDQLGKPLEPKKQVSTGS